MARTPDANDIVWRGTDRQVEVVRDTEHDANTVTTSRNGVRFMVRKERYIVQVRFARYGYNRITRDRVEETRDTYVIARNLSHKAARDMQEVLRMACDDAFGQGYNYAQNS